MMVYEVDNNGTLILNANENFIGNINPFRYKSYYYDKESNLYYLNSRYYSSDICRFISPDDIDYIDTNIINGLNLYCYCKNNPVIYYDPNGNSAVVIGIIIGAIIGAGIGFGGTALADYIDDEQVFNGSINTGSYIANMLIGGLIGGIAPSSYTFTCPIVQFGQITTINGLTFGAASIGTAMTTISGTSIALAIGLVGSVVMATRIGKSGGYRIDHHYPNDHNPVHVHISGDDGMTRVDINGNPIQGDIYMTPGENKAFWKLIKKIIEALQPWI